MICICSSCIASTPLLQISVNSFIKHWNGRNNWFGQVLFIYLLFFHWGNVERPLSRQQKALLPNSQPLRSHSALLYQRVLGCCEKLRRASRDPILFWKLFWRTMCWKSHPFRCALDKLKPAVKRDRSLRLCDATFCAVLLLFLLEYVRQNIMSVIFLQQTVIKY